MVGFVYFIHKLAKDGPFRKCIPASIDYVKDGNSWLSIAEVRIYMANQTVTSTNYLDL
jgi:hypothetical protein